MIRPAAGLLAAFVHLVTASLAATAEPAQTQPPSAGAPPRAVAAGVSIVEPLDPGQTRSYALELLTDQYAAVSVLQQGIDVAVRIVSPDGTTAIEVDGPTGKYGFERARVIARGSGSYRIDVQSIERGVPAGRYTLSIDAVRIAGDDDRTRIEAQTAYLAAVGARTQQRAESLQRAVEGYGQAARLWASAGETGEEAAAENDLGYAYRLLSDYADAREHYQRALTLRRQIGDRGGEAQTLNNLGALAYLNGENQTALQYYEEALPLRQAEGNFPEEALLLSDIGEVYARWSDHQRALEYFRQALPVERRAGDRLRESLTLSNIGLVYRETGQAGEALPFFDDALRSAQAAGNRRVEARVLGNRGAALADVGNTAEALDAYNQALALQRAGGDRLGESETLNAIGVLLERGGDHDQASDHFRGALELQRAIGSPRAEAATLANMAAALAAGNSRSSYEEAESLFGQSLALRRAVQDRRGEAQALYGLARVQRLRGSLDSALRHGEAALEIVEALRTQLVSQEMRTSSFATSVEMYELVTATLMDLAARVPDGGYAARAFEVAERGRARGLLDALSEATGGVRQGIDDQLRRRQRDLQDQINVRAERQIQLLNGPHSDADAAIASRELDERLTALQELEAEIRTRSPRYAELTRPEPLGAAAIQRRVLDADTVLLHYALGAERSYVWVLTTTSLDAAVLAPREQIERAAHALYTLLTARNQDPAGETAAARRQRIASAEVDVSEAAAALGRLILDPVGDRLGTKRLLIVADGALQYIPFGVLQQSGSGSGDAAPLIVRHEIVSAPSASALALLRADRVDARPHTRQIAIFADPVFTATDPRARRHAADVSTRAAQTDDAGPAEAVKRSAAEIGIAGFRRLRFSREEAEAISSLVASDQRLAALDFAASRQAVIGGDLGRYRIVHFSTHALLNNVHPELSGLVLSLVDERGQPQDGFLRLHEIHNLSLTADLVVLSACETALGSQVRGEGLIGLARGFMYAGASRVVASLWNVEDQATAQLMEEFYRRMLVDRLAPAAALRAAQIAMWKNPRWRSPYFWAPFVLQGEWR